MMGTRQERQYVTVVTIRQGIITLIEPTGALGTYRQRGITKYSKQEIIRAIASGLLDVHWEQYKELPRNYTISFEDDQLMGRAKATFNLTKNNR